MFSTVMFSQSLTPGANLSAFLKLDTITTRFSLSACSLGWLGNRLSRSQHFPIPLEAVLIRLGNRLPKGVEVRISYTPGGDIMLECSRMQDRDVYKVSKALNDAILELKLLEQHLDYSNISLSLKSA